MAHCLLLNRCLIHSSNFGVQHSFPTRRSSDLRSVIGFKHNIYKFMPFKENLFLDSDILWCRNPDKLWKLLSPYRFTITRSEEHTSELQSRGHLVCRLLLE